MARLAKDFIWVALMFDLKFILSVCFIDGKLIFDRKTEEERTMTMGEAVQDVSQSMSHGVFSNMIILDLTKRVDITLDSIMNFILPSTNHRFPRIHDYFTKYHSKYEILNPNAALQTAKSKSH